MSLLNDALRAAEQRKNRPEVAVAYGVEPQPARDGKLLLLISVAIWALLIAVMSGYWILAHSSSAEPLVVKSKPTPNQLIQRMAAVVVEQMPEKKPVQKLTPAPQPGPSAVPSPYRPAIPLSFASEAPARTAKAVPVKQQSDAVKIAVKIAVKAENAQPEEVNTTGVKYVPETPAAADRSAARQLGRLIAQGNITDAERGLAALTQLQTAPRSRYVVAGALLLDGKLDQALSWLPKDVIAEHSKLRLLKARALHANNDLAAAVDVLNSNVPPVQSHAEYRVTLATLLQQQGKNTEAARYWAELIAWDDSQSPWWVGLAISLEAQGEPASAATAYRQATELPGLPRSLADYVRQRLQALGAE
jgi:MSHA biogenesis protein MshN